MTGQTHDREPNRWDRAFDWILGKADAGIKRWGYPDKNGIPTREDPTHGRIDRDIQWRVNDEFEPTSIAQRVAIENTLQDKRAKGYDV